MGNSPGGITGPPDRMRQNETPYWNDVPFSDKFNNQYDSGTYSLAYVFAGASKAPVNLTSIPTTVNTAGNGWMTQFTPVASALMLPGLYNWQAILTGTPCQFTGTIVGTTLTLAASPPAGTVTAQAIVTGVGVSAGTVIQSGAGLTWQVNISQSVGPVAMTATLPTRLTPSYGNIMVDVDLTTLTSQYDGRTIAQIGLAQAEAALQTFTGSGGRVKEYTIGGRRMVFMDDKDIISEIDFWRGRVSAEKQKQSGGDRRNIRIGFSRPSSGTPGASQRNWPWF